MKLRIIGEHGTLGSALVETANKAGHAISIDAPVVINCAGIIKQRTDKSNSVIVQTNSLLPHWLSQNYDRFIHVSTDCVFDNSLFGPFDEGSQPCPSDLYGRSKLAGEIYDPPHLTIRTSFIGIGKRGLLADLMQKKGQTIKASRRALWTGHTTIALSRILIELAEKKVSGLLHIPAEAVTRGALIQKLSDAFDLGITVTETFDPGIDRRLISTRWHELNMPQMQTLDEEIKELAEWHRSQ